jgi:hypothetical protein
VGRRDGFRSIPDHHFGNQLALDFWIDTVVLERTYTAGSDHIVVMSEFAILENAPMTTCAPDPWNRLKKFPLYNR